MISPLEVLLDVAQGEQQPLTSTLSALYGALRFPLAAGRPRMIGNFVSTIDGVVTFNDPGASGGGDVSGHNPHDRMVMGILRSVADAVIVGAGTLRADARHIWTPARVFPDLAEDFTQVRRTLKLAPQPLNVFVTARGDIDFSLRVFGGEVPVLIVTTAAGAARLRKQRVPSSVEIDDAAGDARITAQAVIEAILRRGSGRLFLLEGGPRLMADFFSERKVDDFFLTIAPQVAGRSEGSTRPGFVDGALIAPAHPLWGNLASVRRAGDHLFLRYAFA